MRNFTPKTFLEAVSEAQRLARKDGRIRFVYDSPHTLSFSISLKKPTMEDRYWCIAAQEFAEIKDGKWQRFSYPIYQEIAI